jgi:hypothetical protein
MCSPKRMLPVTPHEPMVNASQMRPNAKFAASRNNRLSFDGERQAVDHLQQRLQNQLLFVGSEPVFVKSGGGGMYSGSGNRVKRTLPLSSHHHHHLGNIKNYSADKHELNAF